MPHDLFLTLGVLILIFTIPAIVSALRDGHAPRAAAIMMLIGGGLVATAIIQHPGGYALTDVPKVMMDVLSKTFNTL